MLPKQTELPKELTDELRIRLNSYAAYLPEDLGNGTWRCACGAVNAMRTSCWRCKAEETAVKKCLDRGSLENAHRERMYREADAVLKGDAAGYPRALDLLDALGDYRDAAERRKDAAEKYAAWQEEQKKQAEEKAAEDERKRRKKRKKIIGVLAVAAAAACAALVYFTVIRQQNLYNQAASLAADGQYEAAAEKYTSLGDYKDSEEKEKEVSETAAKESKYEEAQQLFEKEDYSRARNIFADLGSYKDSQAYLEKSNQGIYSEAKQILEEGNYKKARTLFTLLDDYEDSRNYVEECNKEEKYRSAIELLSYEEPNYENNARARESFLELGDYKDAQKYLGQIYAVLVEEHNGRTDGSYNITSYTYDQYGHVTQIALGGTTPETPQMTYDDQGRIVSITETNSFGNACTTTITYDSSNHIIRWASPYTSVSKEYTLDSAGRVIQKTEHRSSSAGGDSVYVYDYSYSASGDTEVVEIKRTEQGTSTVQQYTLYYDASGRLARKQYRYSNVKSEDEYYYAYIWAPDHNANEEFYGDYEIQLNYY